MKQEMSENVQWDPSFSNFSSVSILDFKLCGKRKNLLRNKYITPLQRSKRKGQKEGQGRMKNFLMSV